MGWSMMGRRTRSGYRLPMCFLGLLGLAGCSFLPGTGPSETRITVDADVTKQVRLVDVTPAIAQELLAAYQQSEQHRTAAELTSLQNGTEVVPVMLYPGDTVDVTMWTAPGSSAAQASSGEGIKKLDLGQFTVDESGQLVLPYAGPMPVTGLTMPQAEQNITASFAAIPQFAHPQVSLTMVSNRHQHIVVTGAASRPIIVDWKTGGVSLNDVITEAGGYKGDALTTNDVVILRGDKRFTLSMKSALETNVPLYPGDVVVLEHSNQVQVQCLGGGWTKNTLQTFDTVPTLAAVVAAGGGLSLQVAQGHAVYVLSQDHKTVYRVPWDSLAGLQASQSFPVQNGDTVYIATSPSVVFQQVVTLLVEAAIPVGTYSLLK
jgi:polysaccharide export outer membrane protein